MMYRSSNIQRLKILLNQDRRLFTTSDLSLLWSIENKNTLLTTIKRYNFKGILTRAIRGVYSTVPLDKLDPYELGCAVCGPFSYISAETVLQNKGIIMQNVNKITLFGKKSKDIIINNTNFLCRYLNPSFLLNREGIFIKDKYSIASPERAISDLLFINPKYYIDNTNSINMEKINILRKQIGYI